MRRTLCALVTILCAAPAVAQDADEFIVSARSLGAWVQLQFVTTETIAEICPVEAVDVFISATTFDEDGFVTDGVIDFTTGVPPEAECLDAVGPWSGVMTLQVGGPLPSLWPGVYEVFIDESFEGELWVEDGYVVFAEEALGEAADFGAPVTEVRTVATPASYPPAGVPVPPPAVRPSFLRVPGDELADDLEELEDDRAELADDLEELEDDRVEAAEDLMEIDPETRAFLDEWIE